MDCIALDEKIELGPASGDMALTPLEVLEDSRCPIEADCIWEGQVRLRTQLDLGHETIFVELTTQEPLRINSGMLYLAEVAPEMSTQWSPIKPEHYRFGFRFAPDIMETDPEG